MKKLISQSWWCRMFGCKTYGPYYRMPQSHCWNCGMKTGHANPALNLPDFVEPAALTADLERARLIFQAMSDRVCHVVDCDCLPCDGLRLFKTPAPVAKEDKPLYGEPIGKCATGECGHDDSSWCDRRESK